MKKRKKLIVLFSSLSAIIVASLGVTFAWFAEGSELYVDNIVLDFRGEKELKISSSPDVSTFKEVIDKNDLNKIDEFIPVSSAYSYEWMNEKQTMPKFKSAYSTSSENPVCGNAVGGFFSQEIYLYSKEDDFFATIDKDSVKFEANEARNRELVETVKENYPDLSDDEIFNNLNKVKESLRVSILVPNEDYYQYVIIDPFKNEETLFAGLLDNDGNHYYDSYYKNSVEYETIYGDVNDRSKIVYDSPSSSDSTLVGIPNCFNAMHKEGVRKFNLESSLANGLEIAKEQSMTPSQAEEYLGIPVYAEEPSKIVLSIYLEGWDLDNTNQAMYAAFSVSLKFKISETKGGL